jgi:hypothetical protein
MATTREVLAQWIPFISGIPNVAEDYVCEFCLGPVTGYRRVWLNLELAKRAPECIEYLVVHELVHLLVRHHDDQFHALMDQHLPKWRSARQTLNAVPLAHENWTY